MRSFARCARGPADPPQSLRVLLFYFAYLGAFAPFFALYLTSVGMTAVEIGVVRISGAAGMVAFLGVFEARVLRCCLSCCLR